MKIQQIRNAANKITYAGKTLLLDPWLAPQYSTGSLNSIPGRPFLTPDRMKMEIPMPICPLPMTREEILSGIDAIIITHIHPDHVDVDLKTGLVGRDLPKNLPLFLQNEKDKEIFEKSGFTDLRILSEKGTAFGNMTLYKTPARHGTVIPCGDSMGVILQAQNEKTLYITGDTIWYPEVQKTIEKFHPEIITVNACAAELENFGRLIMNDEDVSSLSMSAPKSTIFITHMDNVAHASITRYTMKGRLAERNVTNYVMPADGEIVEF